MFPLEKYKYFTNGTTEVIAKSTFAGKRYSGKAICDPTDKFDVEKGKKLAAARCNAKICEKRLKLAKKSMDEAIDILERAKRFFEREKKYVELAEEEYKESIDNLESVIKDL